MANKTFLLFLSFVIMTVLVSANRHLMVDSNQGSEESGVNSIGKRGNDGSDHNINSVGKRAIDGSQHNFNSVGKRESDGSEQKFDLIAKRGSDGSSHEYNGVVNGLNGMKVSGVTTGGIGLIPIALPGADGQFQFQLGPISFGANGDIGFIPPGSVISYSQPIVVSPFSPSLSSPPPSPSYANVQPYQQQPGAFQPLPQRYVPYPSSGNVQGSVGGFGSYPPPANVQEAIGGSGSKPPSANVQGSVGGFGSYPPPFNVQESLGGSGSKPPAAIVQGSLGGSGSKPPSAKIQGSFGGFGSYSPAAHAQGSFGDFTPYPTPRQSAQGTN